MKKLKFNSELKKVPLVLLQDKGSASASEMLSGALKDLRRGFYCGYRKFWERDCPRYKGFVKWR